MTAAVAHLTPDRWERATRHLTAKALAEFAHERLLTPAPGDAPGAYTVATPAGPAYHFTARRYALDHWVVAPDSITRHHDGAPLPLDALAFITELRAELGLSDAVLPVYLEEITSTLAGLAYKLSKPPVPAAALATAGDFQAIEAGMTEGHPCFVANNGRLGFGIDAYHAYAPETGEPVRLIWLAAHRDHTVFTASADLTYERLIAAELDEPTRVRFASRLRESGLDPVDYLLVPVHPWQWQHKLSVTFAMEIARQRLVCLGEGADVYQPQQSIRTFFNTANPTKHYVKTALSVLNMGFMRGLSAAYMEATPAINDWLADLMEQDDVLRGSGLTIIRERAAVGYHHEAYEAATATTSPYRKMLAALWRESPVSTLAPGERLTTMAALLHTDPDGDSFAAALINSSGATPEAWLRRYLDAYLRPLLHCFFTYGLVFMPHGENVILVLNQDGSVDRAIFKDIAEEIAVMDPDTVLPPAVERIRAQVPEELWTLSIFTDVFDCFFRFLAPILDERGLLAEETFWRTVGECVSDYQRENPGLTDRFKRYDLRVPEFGRSCLNRLQLRDNQQMVDLADPSSALRLVGTLTNPLA